MRLRSRKLRRKGTVRKAHSGREQARTVIQIKARAKLNLTLDVLGRRDDGYHEIKSVMQSLTLADTLTVERIREGIEVVAEPGVPQGADNLVFQAVEALRRRIPFTAGVRITIEKEIPIAAGLGGGSSDAAAALLAVNHLLHLGLTVGQLLAVGQTLGSDVPFCLLGGTALAQGRGEKLTPLTAPPLLWLALARPPLAVATAAVYAAWDRLRPCQLPGTPRLLAALAGGQRERVIAALGNHLEPVVFAHYPAAALLREKLLAWGAEKVLLCGSGPTLAALAPDAAAARSIVARAREAGYEAWFAHTLV